MAEELKFGDVVAQESSSPYGSMRLMYVCPCEDGMSFYGVVLIGPEGWDTSRLWLAHYKNWRKVDER